MSTSLLQKNLPDHKALSLPYDPCEHPRETARHYISASEQDILEMLKKVGIEELSDLFNHIPPDLRLVDTDKLPDELSYSDTLDRVEKIANKTNLISSFIGDLLPVWKVHPIVHEISKLGQLTTSYTLPT